MWPVWITPSGGSSRRGTRLALDRLRLLARVLVPALLPPVLLLARLGAIRHALAAAAPPERRGIRAGFGLAAVGAHAA